MASLSGKVAVVTGSSRGIGRAIAERLGRDGAWVVVNYCRNVDMAAAAVANIDASGGRGLAIEADLSEVSQTRRLFHEAIAHFGRLDIVVTNAGMARWGPIAEVTEADYDMVFQLNAKGIFFALQEAARYIADGGRIVNITSAATAMSLAGLALYAGSKAASEQFAKSLAKELGPRGVTVNSVSPGFTETDMLPPDPSFRTMAAQMSLLGRLGQPADIAEVVAFLASEESRWITGQTLQVGGGVVT